MVEAWGLCPGAEQNLDHGRQYAMERSCGNGKPRKCFGIFIRVLESSRLYIEGCWEGTKLKAGRQGGRWLQ